MKLNSFDAPHIRHNENTRLLMSDVLLTTLFIYAMAYYHHGPRALTLALASVATAVISDICCLLIARQKINPRDLSSLVTGMLLPLLMPASIDYHIVVIAAAFAIVVAKAPFGGVGYNVFNPAAAGFSFVAICFSDKVFSYPMPFSDLPVTGPVTDALMGVSPAFTLEIGGIPNYDLVEMLLGNYPGPMGATNILVIFACLLYLVFRNTVRWDTPVCFFVTVALFSLLFPRSGAVLPPDIAMRVRLTAYELMSGFLFFGGVYMLGDPVTTPKRDWSKIAFGVVSGVVVMLFRHYGGFEEAFTFSVLLMNAAVWGFDMMGEHLASYIRRKRRRQA